MENFRLKVFRTVAEQASFRKASERLNLSQPAVSQQVHALEEELGVTLFDRSGNRVRLTPAGTVLLKYARRGAQLAREAVEALAKIEGEPRGELRLGASTTVAQYILPRILGAFQKQYPQVALSVTSGNTEHIVEVLLRGGIEMGIIEGPASSRELRKRRFLEDRMVLIVPKGHPWAAMREIPLEALKEVPLLMREPRLGFPARGGTGAEAQRVEAGAVASGDGSGFDGGDCLGCGGWAGGRFRLPVGNRQGGAAGDAETGESGRAGDRARPDAYSALGSFAGRSSGSVRAICPA